MTNTIPDLAPRPVIDKKRSAVYLDVSLAVTIEDFAARKGVSVNRAMVYLLEHGLKSQA